MINPFKRKKKETPTISKEETKKKQEEFDFELKCIREKTETTQELSADESTKINPPMPENMNEKLNVWLSIIRKALFILVIGLCGITLSWMNHARTPDNKDLVNGLALSILANLIIIGVSLLTGTGTEIVKRFYYRFKYKSGKYVNDLLLLKSGVIKEVFTKKDETNGSFRMYGKPYVTNARLMFNYKSIPTYLHREGNPDPVNIWEDKYARELSCGEMDIVMSSVNSFNVIEWLKKWGMYAFIVIGITLLLAGGAFYYAQKDGSMLTKGTYKASPDPVICRLIVPETATINTLPTMIQNPVQPNKTNDIQQTPIK